MLHLKPPKHGKLNYIRISSVCVIINNVLIIQLDETDKHNAGALKIYKDGTKHFIANTLT